MIRGGLDSSLRLSDCYLFVEIPFDGDFTGYKEIHFGALNLG